MSKTAEWGTARKVRHDAEKYIELIGKTTDRTTAASREGSHATAGKLSKLVVSTEINFQPYDGATNYHRDNGFDAALSEVVRKHWSNLCREALDLLREREREAAIAAKAEVAAQLRAIEEAEFERGAA
ncbi:hypothetical protein ROJ8625_04118 [Roseivivax jejudonensis]|uniref:Uncharacterized protein n=1 Tax=Roseivivax jejudonensis TaxID=1529041 RepID=A0A1X7ABC6_9RHOB|nr:hypothetical protein [Roseivivax jejudonensis]SLN74876.1 hypothetical protein ROJ8625_04118 [Roseivivax jejudonensis]